jgi:hypothetical protein
VDECVELEVDNTLPLKVEGFFAVGCIELNWDHWVNILSLFSVKQYSLPWTVAQ